jgi:hypothetical protein
MTVLAPARSRHIDVPFPGGQSYRDVLARTADFLNDLATGWAGARLLVIAHSTTHPKPPEVARTHPVSVSPQLSRYCALDWGTRLLPGACVTVLISDQAR